MRVRFKTKRLEALYYQNRGFRKYPPEVVDGFFEVVGAIEAMVDERDLRQLKSLHYEKLSGDREGQHSLRLHGAWRLIVVPEEDEQGRYLLVDSIVDYH